MMLHSQGLQNKNTSSSRAASAISSFLSPNKSLKFIIDDDQYHLVSCSLLMFQLVSSTNLFDNLIEETLYAHHKQFGYGTTSLLAMWYFWSQECEFLVEKGLKVNDIIDVSRKAVSYLATVIPSIVISTEKLLPSIRKNVSKNSLNVLQKLHGDCVPFQVRTTIRNQQTSTHFQTLKNESNGGIAYGIKLKSRHLVKYISSEENDIVNEVNSCSLTEEMVNQLLSFSERVCHSSPEVSSVLAKAWERQIKSTGSLKFQDEFLTVVSCVGPKSISLIDGLLLKAEGICHKSIENQNQHRILLISGDITMKYMHLGFLPTTTVETVKVLEQLDKSSYCDWLKICTSHLQKLRVSILLVVGAVDAAIEDLCRAQSITMLSKLPWKTINKLSKGLNIAPVSYLLDSEEANISSNVSVTMMPTKSNGDATHICIQSTMQHNDILQSVILSHPSQPVSELLEHQFSHSVFRLMQAANADLVLAGCGHTEKWCSETLTDWSGTLEQDHEREIAQHIANGYLKYYEAILESRVAADNNENVFDNMQAKLEMWNSALSLCFCYLKTDMQIINGCDDASTDNFSKFDLGIGTL